ncbi:hypothetical protein C2U62_05070 [Klebsiella michiganensis]|nr:hypothetical protein [Klebsiella michiganensis]
MISTHFIIMAIWLHNLFTISSFYLRGYRLVCGCSWFIPESIIPNKIFSPFQSMRKGAFCFFN